MHLDHLRTTHHVLLRTTHHGLLPMTLRVPLLMTHRGLLPAMRSTLPVPQPAHLKVHLDLLQEP
ncbi:uncharacterized protein LOC62_04G005606 [Vanrija pseudolonga]|uniref:Uncharacterized protein n=1 Tax=Vanrija pseudolonga TaxID=143232 RepID=A0AAF0YE32_9TREE|nr:hypothetical protein LOC62_04G005606 [Vanrija pseudolonga]